MRSSSPCKKTEILPSNGILDAAPSRLQKQCPPGGCFCVRRGIKGQGRGNAKDRRGFPQKKRHGHCAFCTKNIPIDRRKKIRKKIRVFFKKDLPNARSCDKISLGCKRLVRYKSCRPAICVDAGGCHPAIAAMGYFRGVCPILEPGERITDSDGIRSTGREVASLRNGWNQCSDLIC